MKYVRQLKSDFQQSFAKSLPRKQKSSERLASSSWVNCLSAGWQRIMGKLGLGRRIMFKPWVKTEEGRQGWAVLCFGKEAKSSHLRSGVSHWPREDNMHDKSPRKKSIWPSDAQIQGEEAWRGGANGRCPPQVFGSWLPGPAAQVRKASDCSQQPAWFSWDLWQLM